MSPHTRLFPGTVFTSFTMLLPSHMTIEVKAIINQSAVFNTHITCGPQSTGPISLGCRTHRVNDIIYDICPKDNGVIIYMAQNSQCHDGHIILPVQFLTEVAIWVSYPYLTGGLWFSILSECLMHLSFDVSYIGKNISHYAIKSFFICSSLSSDKAGVTRSQFWDSSEHQWQNNIRFHQIKGNLIMLINQKHEISLDWAGFHFIERKYASNSTLRF